jgi:hypothetical protein
VQVATYGLPTGFFTCSEKGQPYVPVQSVLAAAFIWQPGKVIGDTFLTRSFLAREKR